MRRSLVTAFLSLVIVVVGADAVQAFGCKCNLTQYNAFSPITTHSVSCKKLFCNECTWVVECCPQAPAPVCWDGGAFPAPTAPAAAGAAAPAGAGAYAYPQAMPYPGGQTYPAMVGQPPRMYNGPVPMDATPWQGQTYPVGAR